MQKPATCQQLQPEDRMAIATMRQRGVNVRAIARILERVQSTIACGVTRHTSAVQSDSSLLRHCVGWLAVLPLLPLLQSDRYLPRRPRQSEFKPASGLACAITGLVSTAPSAIFLRTLPPTSAADIRRNAPATDCRKRCLRPHPPISCTRHVPKSIAAGPTRPAA